MNSDRQTICHKIGGLNDVGAMNGFYISSGLTNIIREEKVIVGHGMQVDWIRKGY